MKSSVTVLSLVMVLALMGIVNAAGRSGTKSKRLEEPIDGSGTPGSSGDDGEDGSSSRDNRCNGLVWADMCVRQEAVVPNCERAPEGTKRGDKCRYAAALCTLRPGQERFSEAFKASVKKTCYD